ncbi:MAG TPA: PKD domain-containing protein [Hanamia sp.]|nr:PKD domain-containing protein [Hanamia sp.]
MKSLKKLFFYLLIITLMVGVNSCKKDNAQPIVDVIYTVNVDGLTATFTNQTKGATSYKWEFGDGNSSTDENPVHTYAAKGKFVPTLYATTPSGQTYEGSTVIRLSKGSPIKLDDNSLADWDTVKTNMITSGPKGGIFRELRFDYDGSFIYFYISMMSKKSNGDIFDFYIDADNNAGTGLITSLFTNAGMDVLMEGAMLDNWFDVFYHTGAQNSFTFDQQSINEFYQVGTVVESGGLLKFEGRINRSKIQGLTGKGFKIGITATKNDWSATIGTAPDDGSPAFFLDTSD